MIPPIINRPTDKTGGQPAPHKLIQIFTFFTLPALLFTLEGCVGNVVESQYGLVGVLHDQIFSVLKTLVIKTNLGGQIYSPSEP